MELIRKPASLVWLILMAATVLGTWGVSLSRVPAAIGTTLVFLIAAFKVRLVLLHFMELRTAPLPLRLVFEAWVLVVTAGILAFYFVQSI